MNFTGRKSIPAGLAAPALAALLLCGCTGLGASAPQRAAAVQPVPATQTAASSTASPGYCPSLHLREGTETLRRHAGGETDNASAVIWQASITDTARECRYGDGRLTIRVGVAGRVIAGPRGGPGAVTVPLRIVVLKHPEEVLASELRQVSVTVSASLSAGFSDVAEITVPSPGRSRNYLVYAGFDEAARE
jgi:hypothetical protein